MGLSSSSPSFLPRSKPSSQALDMLVQRRERTPQQEARARRKTKPTFRRNFSGYLFLLPALLIFALFVWYPIVMGFVMSFQNVDMISPAIWVGLLNYRKVFADPIFFVAWRNTLEYTLYALLFGFLAPVILALLVNEMRHGKGFFRLAFYLPVMLSPIVAVFLWRWIYNPDSGLLNALLNLVHLPGGLWLENPNSALPSLMVISTWANGGATMLIYLAGLQGVPASLYEAAEIDGSNIWQRIWNITLPTIRPIMLLMLILQIVATMQVFTEPFTITGGGPQNSTISVVLLIYNYAFRDADFGGASALGVMLFLVLAVFALIYMRMTRRVMEGS